MRYLEDIQRVGTVNCNMAVRFAVFTEQVQRIIAIMEPLLRVSFWPRGWWCVILQQGTIENIVARLFAYFWIILYQRLRSCKHWCVPQTRLSSCAEDEGELRAAALSVVDVDETRGRISVLLLDDFFWLRASLSFSRSTSCSSSSCLYSGKWLRANWTSTHFTINLWASIINTKLVESLPCSWP